MCYKVTAKEKQEMDKTAKSKKIYGKIKKTYHQNSVKERIEALFLDNIGKVITREQIIKVSIDPKTKKQPENWHQRLSELRTLIPSTLIRIQKIQVSGRHFVADIR